MRDRNTNKPRGFGFITFDDPSVVDKVIEDTHAINGKTVSVEIKRTIPKGAAPLKDFKTRKIFVGGIPTSLTEDEFKDFFSQFGKVDDHEIIRDHTTNRSRGFGFIVFESEKVVDDLLAKKGNMIDLAGSQVSLVQCLKPEASNRASLGMFLYMEYHLFQILLNYSFLLYLPHISILLWLMILPYHRLP
ncbi:hypothetical protein GW17_00039091 [Ensete ventricosum]|nr:hypothetical protein GW17_00039091 [Ensete ventricosum]